MKKILYFLLFSLSCAFISCSSVDDEEEDLPTKKRLVEYKILPAESFEFTYNNQGNIKSYKQINGGQTTINANFLYENDKLAHVNIDAYHDVNTGKADVTLDEKIIYHTNDTILIEATYDKGTQDEYGHTDTLLIDPVKRYLLETHYSGGGKQIYTYDKAGNILTEKGIKTNLIGSEVSYTYDSNPLPFSTLKGIPHWYWVYLEYESVSVKMYPGANNRIERKIKETSGMGSINIATYRYDYEKSGYPIKKYHSNQNGENLKEEYIYEEY